MMTLTQEQTRNLAEKLRNFAPNGSKIKYNVNERSWEVKYEEAEYIVIDSYRFTSNRGFVNFATIKMEI